MYTRNEKMIQFDDEICHRLGLLTKTEIKYSDQNNNNQYIQKHHTSEKYLLRPRIFLRKHNSNSEDEERDYERNKKLKRKAAPLSKYRRRNANARERTRMKEINRAFETLRKVVPQMAYQHQQNEKLTKITTLRLAMKYISTLSEVLSNQRSLSDENHFERFLLESDEESSIFKSDTSDHSILSTGYTVEFDNESIDQIDLNSLSCDTSHQLTQFDSLLFDTF
ncbi:neurogenic differentiation factor 6-like [Diorhabda sublineata]|uniref:neurogenic differentiation factor 6-like n=1 Tax=Diorhabda sublineata TaxID=1163346 RepID=UPI0024E0C165|nr:neurogenic differentiation factor 6-like [Diorhabda sublineata]XP_056648917.1 neurogenic differentiation factor 6-like [Diorhabda sublineata]